MRVLIGLTLFLSPCLGWAAPASSVVRSLVPQLALQTPPQNDCVTQFLSSAGFTSSTLSTGWSADLPPNAEAYLRFLWAGYKSKFIDVEKLSKVAMSIVPANPFREAAEDSLEAGLHRAIAAKIANMSGEEWSAITNELHQILPRLSIEKEEREGAEEDASWVTGDFSHPQVLDLSATDRVRTISSWHEHEGRLFLAALSIQEHEVYVFELDLSTGQLIKRDKIGNFNERIKGPRWHTQGHQLYLVMNDTSALFLLEFDLHTNTLIKRDEKVTRVIFPPSWYAHDSRDFLAVTKKNGRGFNVYELVAGRLNSIYSQDLTSASTSPPSWFKDGQRVYVSLVMQDRYILFFELVGGELIYRGRFAMDLTYDLSPAWVEHEHRNYVALSLGKAVHLYEFDSNNTTLVEKDSKVFLGEVSPEAHAWHKHVGRTYFMAGSDDGYIHLFELVAGRLVPLANYNVGSTPIRSPSFLENDGRLYLVAGSRSVAGARSDNAYLFEIDLATPQLILVDTTQVSAGSWPYVVGYANQERFILSLISPGGRLSHFNIYKKMKGRGR